MSENWHGTSRAYALSMVDGSGIPERASSSPLSIGVKAVPRRLWLLLLGVCVTLPTLGDGFLTDDHRFRALVTNARGAAALMPDLFAFALGKVQTNLTSIADGGLPWWTAC